MDQPGQSVLLTLLTADAEAALVAKLGSMIETGGGFSFAHERTHQGPPFDVIYRGVALRVSVRLLADDLAGAKQIFCNLDPQSIEAGIDIGLGDHVPGGERVPAIVQVALDAARAIGTQIGARAVLWQPAGIVSGIDYFAETVADYLGGGAFPVLAMVNFKGAGDETITSHGLATLSGQELLVDGHGMDQSELMRRVVRVVHDMAVNGPFAKATELAGIEPGEFVAIEPIETGMLKMNAYPAADV